MCDFFLKSMHIRSWMTPRLCGMCTSKVELFYNQPILFKFCASMIECSSPKRLSPWCYEGQAHLVIPKDFLCTQADCLKAKKAHKEGRKWTTQQNVDRKDKIDTNFDNTNLFRVLKAFLHQLLSTKFQCGPNQSSVRHNHKDSQQWKRGKVTWLLSMQLGVTARPKTMKG